MLTQIELICLTSIIYLKSLKNKEVIILIYANYLFNRVNIIYMAIKMQYIWLYILANNFTFKMENTS